MGRCKIRLGVHSVALVKALVTVKLGLRKRQVLVFAQYSRIKSTALHLHQLVDEHIASGANFACKPQAAAQQKSLAEGAAIGELGEIQVDALNAFKAQRAGIDIVGKF
jgi:hypothetical protein